MDQPESESKKHLTTLRVRYAETDQMGVVYHANYLIWMEVGRVELLRSRGFNYKDLEQSEGLYLTVVDVSCRYHCPARYDEQVAIQTVVKTANARMIEFSYEIHSLDSGRTLITGSTRHIWLNKEWRLTRLPPRYHGALQLG